MTKLESLIAEADALRALPDEEAEARGLPGLVEMINAIRAGGIPDAEDVEEGADAVMPKRRGRPPKVRE